MNVWQGTFPSDNTLADGYLGTAPGRCLRRRTDSGSTT